MNGQDDRGQEAPIFTVTVVVPSWNSAATISRALASVRAQTVSPAQVIVVDDGSTDGSDGLASKFGVSVLRCPHRGAAAARNTGWRAATTAWVAFLDADDEWLPHKLQTMRELSYRRPDASILYSDAVRVVDDEDLVRWSIPAPFRENAVLEHVIVENFICQSTVLVRREALERVGGYDESFEAWEDIDLWIRLACNYPFAFVPDVLVRYHMVDGSLSNRAISMAEGRLRSLHQVASLPEVADLPRATRRAAFGRAWLQMAEAYYNAGRSMRVEVFVWRALAVNPTLSQGLRAGRLAGKALVPGNVRRILRRRRTSRIDRAMTLPTTG